MSLDVRIFWLRVQNYRSSMVIERIQLRNIANLRIDNVHCFHFDERNLEES